MSAHHRSRIALLIALAADLALPVGPGWLYDSMRAPMTIEQASIAAAITAMETHTDNLLSIPGVVGTAIGMSMDGQPVVKVYLADRMVVGVPAALDGVATDTEVTGAFYSLDPRVAPARSPEMTIWGNVKAGSDVNRRSHFPRPVPIGVSSGQQDVTAGTIGARVTNGTEIFALSNNHVFANSNRASIGDPVLQPGSLDGGNAPDDAIGHLVDFEEIKFCTLGGMSCPNNRIDAAIAGVTEKSVGRATPSDGYGTPRIESVTANLMTKVQKYGRTTGLTTGTVSGVFATVNVDYRVGIARFVDQIIITGTSGEFSGPGDSGSLVVTKGSGSADRRPLGLLFGGSRLTTIVSPIDLVLDRFGVTIDGEG